MSALTGERAERSELHRRVRAFITKSVRGEAPAETFDTLALDIARHQAAHVPAVGRLFASRGCHLMKTESVRELPALPTDVFRLTRIAAHPPADDVAVFRTSGTTSGARGEHHLSSTATYEEGALAWGRWALFFDVPRPDWVIALAPPRGASSGDSSLHFMMHLFASELAGEADTLGGDALAGAAPRRSFLQPSPDKLAEPGDLVRAVVDASKRGAPVLLMGASFAFVHVFDALRDERLVLPPDSRIMHTGGFKGRSREVAPDELRARMATTFGVAESAVVGEYGMTELSSQLYEGTLRAARGAATPSARHGVFVAPPWLRVAAADPDTLEPLPEGEIGILRFEDLANVDSALIVQTADRGRCGVSTVELLGRSPGAVPRGCSLTVEELMGRP
jgi:hypothetical protein